MIAARDRNGWNVFVALFDVLLEVTTSEIVLFFGRRPIRDRATHLGPAYENRQRTKPREGREVAPRRASLWGFEGGARMDNGAEGGWRRVGLGRGARAARHQHLRTCGSES